MTRPSPASARPPSVLLLNHHQDPLADLVHVLTEAGFLVTETQSLADSHRALERMRPTVVVLNPLIPTAGGVELDLVADLQRENDPVPVLFLVEDPRAFPQVQREAVPLCDFALKPCRTDEIRHRIERAVVVRRNFTDLSERARELEGQVSIDFKTGLLSERYFKQTLVREFKRAQRHQAHLALLLLDVDNFKGVNDTTEYAFGDAVLRHVAEALQRNTREIDYAARFGGDEFALLLPHTSPANAVQTAIRIRKMIAEIEIRDDRYAVRVTASVGIDTYDGRTAVTPEEFVRRANKALQEAKRRGKNQVWLYAGDDLGAEAS
ncbi:MAG: diguanylate cyclase [Planctomycetota bacterium]